MASKHVKSQDEYCLQFIKNLEVLSLLFFLGVKHLKETYSKRALKKVLEKEYEQGEGILSFLCCHWTAYPESNS